MIRLEGKYKDFTSISQGDGVGPHVETAFLSYLREACHQEGWVWE